MHPEHTEIPRTKQKYLNKILYFLKPGHAKAENLVKAIKNEMTDMNARDLLQISMAGPAVFNIFKGELERDFGHLLIDIGSCGLHTLHNAFQ